MRVCVQPLRTRRAIWTETYVYFTLTCFDVCSMPRNTENVADPISEDFAGSWNAAAAERTAQT